MNSTIRISDQTHSANTSELRFSLKTQFTMGFGLCTLFIITLPFIPWAAPILAVGLAILFYFIRNELVGLIIYVSINALSLIMTRSEGYGATYIVIAVVTSSIIITLFIRMVLSREGRIIINHSQTFFSFILL
jgi:hypothetical protein